MDRSFDGNSTLNPENANRAALESAAALPMLSPHPTPLSLCGAQIMSPGRDRTNEDPLASHCPVSSAAGSAHESRSAPSAPSSVSFRLPTSNSARSRSASAEDEAESDNEGGDEDGVFVEALGSHNRDALVLAARALGLGIAAAVIISGLLLLGVVRLGLSSLIGHFGVVVVVVAYVLGARTLAKRAGYQLPGDISQSNAIVSSSSGRHQQQSSPQSGGSADAAVGGEAAAGGLVSQQREAQWRVLRAVAANACS